MALIGALQVTRSADIIRAIGAALFIVIVATLTALLVRHEPSTACWWYGALTVAAFYAISMSVSGAYNPLYLAMGADNVMSVSKFQFLVWNAAVVFSCVWIYAVRYSHGLAEPTSGDNGLPHNVLIAMGVSIASFAAAKGITVSYLAAGRISKPAADQPNDNVINLVAEGGQPDLVKIQMLVWTLIAVGIFIAATIHAVATNTDPKTLQLGWFEFRGHLDRPQPPAGQKGEPWQTNGASFRGNSKSRRFAA